MAVVARASVPFDLKSASLSGLALVLRTCDLAVLARAMTERFGEASDLFGFEAVAIDLTGLPEGSSLDFEALVEMLLTHRLRASGVRGGSDELMQSALAAGLGDVTEDAGAVPTPRREVLPPEAQVERQPVAAVDAPPEKQAELPAVEQAIPEPAESAQLSAPTMIVDKPLRSGQQVYAKGGDLVVLATVNVGAEVIADGNIHVYGPLRGKAVAGAKGNTEARIFSTCMEPQLLAIAGTYRTTENPLPAEVLGKPAQIRLAGERLVFEPLD